MFFQIGLSESRKTHVMFKCVKSGAIAFCLVLLVLPGTSVRCLDLEHWLRHYHVRRQCVQLGKPTHDFSNRRFCRVCLGETIADNQLAAFKRNPANKGTGLPARSVGLQSTSELLFLSGLFGSVTSHLGSQRPWDGSQLYRHW